MSKKLMREIDKILEGSGRPQMLAQAVPFYRHKESRIPEMIRMSFEDGTTVVYHLRGTEMPPEILENIRIIRKWKDEYNNQPMRRRRKE